VATSVVASTDGRILDDPGYHAILGNESGIRVLRNRGMSMNQRIMLIMAGLLVSAAALPQSQPISQGLGVIVYPAKNQASSKQAADEHECYNWAQGRTGITPGPPPAATTPSTQPTSSASAGGGAVKGAVAGVAIGAVAGDAGKGAAIGATTGLLAGAHQARKSQQQQQAQAQTTQQTDAANLAAYNDRMGTFKKAFGTCLQGRGYTVSN
jgi:Glycine-zipper domain